MSQFTGPDIVALSISLLALALAGWQFLSDRLDKRVRLSIAAFPSMTMPDYDENPQFEVVVQITNIGRITAGLRSVEVRTSGRKVDGRNGGTIKRGIGVAPGFGNQLPPLKPLELASYDLNFSEQDKFESLSVVVTDTLGKDWRAPTKDENDITGAHHHWVERIAKVATKP